MNTVIKQHTFLVSSQDLSQILRPYLQSRFPSTFGSIEQLNISRIVVDIVDPTTVKIIFEENIKE